MMKISGMIRPFRFLLHGDPPRLVACLSMSDDHEQLWHVGLRKPATSRLRAPNKTLFETMLQGGDDGAFLP